MKNIVKDGNVVKRKSKVLAIVLISVAVVVLSSVLVFFLSRMVKNSRNNNPSVHKLYSLWDQGEYEKVYSDSLAILEKNELNAPAMVMHGYSAFFIALAQTDITNTQSYVDECIFSLRKSLYYADKASLPQIQYMLGKAYFQKNTISSAYYYSDLVIKYLNLALENGYEAPDIHECLALCYADLGMTVKSVMEFTMALKSHKTDTLLYAIALQYHKLEKDDIAKPYLVEIMTDSQDDDIILKSSLLLAEIYFLEGSYGDARTIYENVLEKFPDCAEGLDGLGNIYEKNGDIAKARSEWRKTLKVQVNHAGAIKKLGL